MNEEMLEKVLSIINANVENEELTSENINDNLMELGMDSIALIKIVVELEEQFDCEIPDSKLLLSELNTINKILQVICSILHE